MSSSKVTHYRPENFRRLLFSAEWCGWKRSRGGQAGVVTDAIVTTLVEEVSCRKCLAKIAAKAAPVVANVVAPVRAKKVRTCDWCAGSGRYGDKGRFDAATATFVDAVSYDFCSFCLGAGKVLR